MTVAYKAYEKMYRCQDRLSFIPPEDSIEDMAKFGITRAVLRGTHGRDTDGVFELCKQFPETFIGFAGVQAHQTGISQAMKDLEYAYEECGFHGLSLSPMFSGIYINDKRYYPLYAYTEKMGKVLIAHTALHMNPELPYDLGDPLFLDRVAIDFPDLKIVMGHAGHGFDLQAISVAMRQKNVYLEFSALGPETVRPEVIFAINTFLRKRAIFGTSYPLMDFDVVERWKRIINEQNHQLFFHDNAAKLMGLID